MKISKTEFRLRRSSISGKPQLQECRTGREKPLGSPLQLVLLDAACVPLYLESNEDRVQPEDRLSQLLLLRLSCVGLISGEYRSAD